jgi:hypothetical protein
MSTKTLRKRIALVAVSVMGAGVLSVAPANAAAVAVGEFTFNAITLQAGVCARDTTAAAQGLVVVAGSSFTAALDQASTDTDDFYVSTSGNVTVGSATGTGIDGVTLTSVTAAAAHNSDIVVTFVAGAVGSGTISVKENATASTLEVLSVTVVAACATNVLSLADSFIEVSTQANADDNIDETASLSVSNGSTTYINLALRDAYLNALSGAGVLAATATNGAVINWDSAPSVQSSVAYLSTRGAAGTELFVTQGLANKDKPLTTTVTITLDGAAVTTKTINFRGVPASIKISSVKVGKVGSTGVFDAQVLDAAGVALPSQTVANSSTANSVAEVAAIANISTSAVTQADGSATSSSGGTRGAYSCVKSGKTTLTVQTTISSVAGTSVKQTFPVVCGDVLDTWTISMDKASYAPGEIATLTVSGKDVKGFEVNSTDTLGTLEYSFGGMTAVTAPTSADKFDSANGAKKYSFSVGTTEGAFVGTFKIAGATDTAAKTVQYKVAAPSSGAVSNADVLKAIVSLIASINKQIAALQKALLKR